MMTSRTHGVLTFEQKESRSNAAALHKNRGFEVECQFHLQESNLGSANDGESEKENWQDKSEACILGAAGLCVDSGFRAASGAAGPGRTSEGKAATEGFDAAGWQSCSRGCR